VTRLSRRRDDRGQLAALEMMFGFMWVVTVALVVMTIPNWVSLQSAARAAADEAARAVVTAESCDAGQARGAELVRDIEEAHGLDSGDLALSWSACSLDRGAEVTAHVTFTVDAVSLPMNVAIGEFTRTVSHTESVDLYRSE